MTEVKKELLRLKELEIEKLKKEISEESTQLKVREELRNYFDKHFGLPYISDNYNVYPEEYHSQAMAHFISNSLNATDEEKKINLENIRLSYIQYLKSDIELLQEQLEHVESIYDTLK